MKGGTFFVFISLAAATLVAKDPSGSKVVRGHPHPVRDAPQECCSMSSSGCTCVAYTVAECVRGYCF
ncbi:hypothetical protein JMJ77_0012060 [Colletotrichum scovillei]|uniref:Uncharacterized protein n=1 Tax=Colletotrichum scovillei TaxID=1209932 RepID=A0A9P7U8E6_9PEZI|nr:hypothetical protein JMJ77_0012060 [Colletotrichum scovillei]KAG7046345.1 hypothetical protein JMJ78_0011409 [Colletotrichum scovillei]KAG7063697.1 hypothetical protein JMJ76_0006156 [Colletotrichum scovillei]